MVQPVDDSPGRSRDGVTPPTDQVPRRNAPGLRLLGRTILGLMGWEIEGALPNRPRLLVIAAPHTSNWDFVVGMAATLALDVDAHWIGKHTLFRGPFGRFMRYLGGIPVDRSASSGLVEQIVDRFNRSERFVLGLAPEGTRKQVTKWKSGFYYISSGAGVPIVCAYFDYEKKVVGIGPEIVASGDYEADLKRIMNFYAPIRARSGRPGVPPAP